MHRALNAEGKPIPVHHNINIVGCVFGVHEERPDGAIKPVLFKIDGDNCLPIFSSVERMKEVYNLTGAEYRKIKKIDAPQEEFLKSFPKSIKVVKDPWITNRGSTRFTVIELP